MACMLQQPFIRGLLSKLQIIYYAQMMSDDLELGNASLTSEHKELAFNSHSPCQSRA